MRKVLVAALLAALALTSGALAAPPRAVPVPPEVVAAHPDGHAGGLTATAAPALVSPSADERISCWRAYLTGDNSGWYGTEQQTINPYWCGNGSATRGVDNSWHYQSCTLLVSCDGQSGPFSWYGCANGCASYGGEIIGRFSVYVFTSVHVDLTVLYELYGNGTYWAYEYHD